MIQRDFLWGGRDGSRGMCWVAWHKVCRDKKEGGLGIKNLESFNIALLSKWKWRFLVDESANWRDILSYRYGDLTAFISKESRRNMKTDSLWWRDLFDVGEEEFGGGWFDGVIRRGLGGGEGVDFWRHHWVDHQPLYISFPYLFAGFSRQKVTVAEAGQWTDNVWRWSLLNNVVGDAFVMQEAADLSLILRDLSPVRGSKDSWKWILNQDKIFSVKSAYKQLQQLRVPVIIDEQVSARLQAVWLTAAPSKIQVFGWRIFSSALPIRASLLHRNVIRELEEAACVFCSDDFEELDHLLVTCVFAGKVWEKVFLWLGVDPIVEVSVADHFDSFAQVFGGKNSKKAALLIWLASCWSIWLARNNSIFKGIDPDVDSIVWHIKSMSWSWFIYGVGSHSGYVVDSWWNNAFHCINHFMGSRGRNSGLGFPTVVHSQGTLFPP